MSVAATNSIPNPFAQITAKNLLAINITSVWLNLYLLNSMNYSSTVTCPIQQFSVSLRAWVPNNWIKTGIMTNIYSKLKSLIGNNLLLFFYRKFGGNKQYFIQDCIRNFGSQPGHYI